MAKSVTSSPKGGKKGCLCKDGKTYSKDCCEGELINQGIGDLKDNTDSEQISTATVTDLENTVMADGGNVISVINTTGEPRVIVNSH